MAERYAVMDGNGTILYTGDLPSCISFRRQSARGGLVIEKAPARQQWKIRYWIFWSLNRAKHLLKENNPYCLNLVLDYLLGSVSYMRFVGDISELHYKKILDIVFNIKAKSDEAKRRQYGDPPLGNPALETDGRLP
jgi:hypothetical protein